MASCDGNPFFHPLRAGARVLTLSGAARYGPVHRLLVGAPLAIASCGADAAGRGCGRHLCLKRLYLPERGRSHIDR